MVGTDYGGSCKAARRPLRPWKLAFTEVEPGGSWGSGLHMVQLGSGSRMRRRRLLLAVSLLLLVLQLLLNPPLRRL